MTPQLLGRIFFLITCAICGFTAGSLAAQGFYLTAFVSFVAPHVVWHGLKALGHQL